MIKGIVPTLSEAGKIKIGHRGEARKSKSGNLYRLPVKLDHFLITTTERERDEAGRVIKDGNFVLDKDLMGVVANGKDKITEIPIVLHSDVIDEVFPTAYALYAGKKIVCRGDGEKACRWETKNGERTGNRKNVSCPCEFLGATGKHICKPNGVLHCSIAVPGYAVAGAVHKWRTTSIISVQRMIGSLRQILSVCGSLRGIPLWLKLEPVQVAPAGAPASTVYCCHVELRAKNLLEVQKKALELATMRAALGGHGESYRALISPPASDYELEEETVDTQAEFYPEEVIDDNTGEVVEGLSKFSNNDRELWGFEEAEYEESSSAADGTPPPPKTKTETREEETKPLKSEKVA